MMQYNREQIHASCNIQLSSSATCPGSLYSGSKLPNMHDGSAGASNFVAVVPLPSGMVQNRLNPQLCVGNDLYVMHRLPSCSAVSSPVLPNAGGSVFQSTGAGATGEGPPMVECSAAATGASHVSLVPPRRNSSANSFATAPTDAALHHAAGLCTQLGPVPPQRTAPLPVPTRACPLGLAAQSPRPAGILSKMTHSMSAQDAASFMRCAAPSASLPHSRFARPTTTASASSAAAHPPPPPTSHSPGGEKNAARFYANEDIAKAHHLEWAQQMPAGEELMSADAALSGHVMRGLPGGLGAASKCPTTMLSTATAAAHHHPLAKCTPPPLPPRHNSNGASSFCATAAATSTPSSTTTTATPSSSSVAEQHSTSTPLLHHQQHNNNHSTLSSTCSSSTTAAQDHAKKAPASGRPKTLSNQPFSNKTSRLNTPAQMTPELMSSSPNNHAIDCTTDNNPAPPQLPPRRSSVTKRGEIPPPPSGQPSSSSSAQHLQTSTTTTVSTVDVSGVSTAVCKSSLGVPNALSTPEVESLSLKSVCSTGSNSASDSSQVEEPVASEKTSSDAMVTADKNEVASAGENSAATQSKSSKRRENNQTVKRRKSHRSHQKSNQDEQQQQQRAAEAAAAGFVNPYPSVIKRVTATVYRRFMEQKVANLGRLHREREARMARLEADMERASLEESVRRQVRLLLCMKESNHMRTQRSKMDQAMFNRIKRLGVGAFGKVWLVRKKDNRKLYAMKLLNKRDVVQRRQLAHVQAERDILAEADNERVVKLFFSFQDVHTLYLVMEYIPGGDMMSLLIKKGIFEEELSRFYTAELTLALESVHAMGFVHRDIKPDNILITKDGHIKLTDFGLCTGFRCTHSSKYWENDTPDAAAKANAVEAPSTTSQPQPPTTADKDSVEEGRDKVAPEIPSAAVATNGGKNNDTSAANRRRSQSLVGTPNYIAPEILRRKEYDERCDWWSVGVILYEMLVGQPPFLAQTAMDTQIRVVQWRRHLRIPGPPRLSAPAADLIGQFLRDPADRLSQPALIRTHAFFSCTDWDKITTSTAPYVPLIRDELDTSNFDAVEDDYSLLSEAFSSHSSLAGGTGTQQLPFPNFTFKRFFDCNTLRAPASTDNNPTTTASASDSAHPVDPPTDEASTTTQQQPSSAAPTTTSTDDSHCGQ